MCVCEWVSVSHATHTHTHTHTQPTHTHTHPGKETDNLVLGKLHPGSLSPAVAVHRCLARLTRHLEANKVPAANR